MMMIMFSFKIKNLDSIYAQKEDIGLVTITGNVKHPGNLFNIV